MDLRGKVNESVSLLEFDFLEGRRPLAVERLTAPEQASASYRARLLMVIRPAKDSGVYEEEGQMNDAFR